MNKTIVSSNEFQIDIINSNLRITHFNDCHWDGDIEIPLEVIMKFVNDTKLSKETFPDYPDRTLDYFDIDEFSIDIVCHLDGNEEPTYIQVADFIEAQEVWNAPDFRKYVE